MNRFSLLPLLLAFASTPASATDNSGVLRGSTPQISSNHYRDLAPLEQPLEPRAMCQDDMTEKFMLKKDGKKRDCEFYAVNGKCYKEITTGGDDVVGKYVAEICQRSCEVCDTDPNACKDEKAKKDKFRLKEGGQKKTCEYYSKNNKCNTEIAYGGNSGRFVWEVCNKSCKRCGNCKNEKKNKDKFMLKEDGQKKNCEFYAKNDKCNTEIAWGDDSGKFVWEVCNMSCNRCDNCKNEKKNKKKFMLEEGGEKEDCKFYAKNDKCDTEIAWGDDSGKSVWEVCKSACNRCGSDSPKISEPRDCEDEKKEKEQFMLKEGGQKKDCAFYAKNGKCDKEITWGDDAGKSVWEVCQSSCDRCDA